MSRHRIPMLRWPQRLSNRLALVSGLQLLLVAGGFGVLSFSLGRISGLERSEAYRQNASVVELSTRLSREFNYPIWINNLNLLWLQQPGRVRDYAGMVERFSDQIRVFPVDYINYGDADGSFVGMERTREGELLLNEDTNRSGRGSMAVYSIQADGRPGPLLERIPEMTETHEEAWYTDTARAGKPTWSSIYAWEDQPEVFSISYNAPLYGPGRRLQGVVGVDVVLTQLSDWLQKVWRNRPGLALIVEPDGRLVASSLPDTTLQRNGEQLERARLEQVDHPLARELAEHYPHLRRDSQPERVSVGGQLYTLQASSWGREEGLDWLLLTALAVDPSSAAAERNSLLALLAAGAALVGAVVLINRQIQGLLQPLQQLEVASASLSQTLAQRSGNDTDLDNLQFNSGLSANAGEELSALNGAIGELVQRYNGLTTDLRKAQERERYRDAQALALLKDKLRSSLQAAAVAHEINQPLSVLLLNSQLLLDRSQRDPTTPVPPAWREQLESIRREADRVVLTIEKMRALLRNVQTEHQRLDLREVAQSALLYARSGGVAGRIPIDSRGLEDIQEHAWIDGDAVQIQIAIVNLLRNAAEALVEHGSETPWISVDLARQGDQWCLSVADNGPGLPPNALDDTPLQTTKASGSGLGLFVVRTTMENHHGTLHCAVSARGGALLQLRFPAADDPALPTTGD